MLGPSIVLLSLSGTSAQQTKLPNIDYLLQGYDIVYGNPKTDGMDPGFTTVKIFEADYSGKVETGDGKYSLPDGTAATNCAGTCQIKFSSTDTMRAKQYKNELSIKAETSVSGSAFGIGMKFSASAGYKHVSQVSSKTRNVFIQSEVSCCQYKASLEQGNPPKFTQNFITLAKGLPEEYDANKYFNFIKNFGTHWVRETEMGGTFGQEAEITEESVEKMTSDGVDIKVAAEASGWGMSAAASLETKTDSEKAEQFNSNCEDRKTWTIGAPPVAGNDMEEAAVKWANAAKEAPAPMQFKLEQIDTLFDGSWEVAGLPKMDKVKENVLTALKGYCDYLLDSHEVDSCDPPVDDDDRPECENVAWPVGAVYRCDDSGDNKVTMKFSREVSVESCEEKSMLKDFSFAISHTQTSITAQRTDGDSQCFDEEAIAKCCVVIPDGAKWMDIRMGAVAVPIPQLATHGFPLIPFAANAVEAATIDNNDVCGLKMLNLIPWEGEVQDILDSFEQHCITAEDPHTGNAAYSPEFCLQMRKMVEGDARLDDAIVGGEGVDKLCAELQRLVQASADHLQSEGLLMVDEQALSTQRLLSRQHSQVLTTATDRDAKLLDRVMVGKGPGPSPPPPPGPALTSLDFRFSDDVTVHGCQATAHTQNGDIKFEIQLRNEHQVSALMVGKQHYFDDESMQAHCLVAGPEGMVCDWVNVGTDEECDDSKTAGSVTRTFDDVKVFGCSLTSSTDGVQFLIKSDEHSVTATKISEGDKCFPDKTARAWCCMGPDTATTTTEEPTTAPEDPTTAPEDPTTAPEDPTTGPEEPTTAPEDPTTAPEEPTTEPEDPTTAPEDPTTAPEDPTTAPEDPTTAPEDPTTAPEDPTTAPEDPTTGPEDPTTAPEDPTTAPEDPTTAPEDPTTAPEGPTTAPEDPTTAPEDPTTAPEDPTTGPEDPTTAPEDPTTAPEDPTTAPEDPTTAPEDPTTAPEDPTTAPEDPTTAPEDPTTAPEDPTTAPADPTTVPEDPTTAPEDPTTAPEDPTTAPEDPTTAPEDPTTAPEDPTTAPEEPTTAPEEPTTAPEDPTTEPEDPTTSPEDPTTSPEDPTTAPEDPTTVPEDPTTVPEDPTTAPEDPTTLPEDPTTVPEDPTTAPEEPTTAPEDPTTAPEEPTTAPEEPTTAPEDPTTAPEDPTTAPEDPTTAPEEPTTEPEDPTTAPEDPTTAPEDPTTAPEDPTTEPEDPTTAPEDPTTAPEDPTSAPEDPTTAPEDPTTSPEDPTTAPEDPTTAPEDPTTAPEDPTTAPEEPTTVPDEPTTAPEQPTTTPWGPKPSDEECRVCDTMCSPCKACADSQEGECYKCWHCWDYDDDELEDKDEKMDKDCDALHKDHDWDDDEVRCLHNDNDFSRRLASLGSDGRRRSPKPSGGDGRRRSSPSKPVPDCRACWDDAPTPAPTTSTTTTTTTPVQPTTPVPEPQPDFPGEEACRPCVTTCSPCRECAEGPEGSFEYGSCDKCWHCWDWDDDKLEDKDEKMDKDCDALHKDHDWDDDEVRCLHNDFSRRLASSDGRRRSSPSKTVPDCRACWAYMPVMGESLFV